MKKGRGPLYFFCGSTAMLENASLYATLTSLAVFCSIGGSVTDSRFAQSNSSSTNWLWWAPVTAQRLEKPGRRQTARTLGTPQGPCRSAVLSRFPDRQHSAAFRRLSSAPWLGTKSTWKWCGGWLERGGSTADKVSVRMTLHDEANIWREATSGTRVTAIGVLETVSQPVTT